MSGAGRGLGWAGSRTAGCRNAAIIEKKTADCKEQPAAFCFGPENPGNLTYFLARVLLFMKIRKPIKEAIPNAHEIIALATRPRLCVNPAIT